jgi:hypothetical protein
MSSAGILLIPSASAVPKMSDDLSKKNMPPVKPDFLPSSVPRTNPWNMGLKQAQTEPSPAETSANDAYTNINKSAAMPKAILKKEKDGSSITVQIRQPATESTGNKSYKNVVTPSSQPEDISSQNPDNWPTLLNAVQKGSSSSKLQKEKMVRENYLTKRIEKNLRNVHIFKFEGIYLSFLLIIHFRQLCFCFAIFF